MTLPNIHPQLLLLTQLQPGELVKLETDHYLRPIIRKYVADLLTEDSRMGWDEVDKQREALQWISADIYMKAAHMGEQQAYGDILKPTVVQMFQALGATDGQVNTPAASSD